MGLLDKILKEGAEALKDVASDENKKKAADLFGSLKDSFEEHKDDLKKAVDELKDELGVDDEKQVFSSSSESSHDYFPEEFDETKSCREKILECLAKEFPSYTVRENVSPREFGGTGKFMDYSIVVCDGNTPKLIMMLIGKTTTAHREYRWSREFAEGKGYAFINFVEHFPNLPEYISERLHKYL